MSFMFDPEKLQGHPCVYVDAPLKQHSLDFVACRQVALYTVIILQKGKVSEHSSWTVAYSETW